MRSLIPLLLVLFSANLFAQNTTLYKTVDEDGNVTFTDTPPADSDAEQIEIRNDRNVVPSDDIRRSIEEQNQLRAQQETEKKRELERWKLRYDKAQQELKAAEQAHEDAQVLGEGDVMGSAMGGARPSEAWIERLEQSEKNLEAAQQAVRKLEAERRQLQRQ